MNNLFKEPGLTRTNLMKVNVDQPMISIITPFYNASEFFMQTFNSVMNQTFPWFEWIIINDGSNKKKDIQLLGQVQDMDHRIRLFNKTNGGIASARNLAIEKARSEIIVPLDSDDLIAPTYLEKVFWGLYFNQNASWCYTDTVGFYKETYLWQKEFSSDVMKTENILVCTAAIRKNALVECDNYYEREKHHNEDWNLWLRFLSKGFYPVHIKEYLFWYRRSSVGVLTKVKEDPEISKRNKALINEAAKLVPNGIRAKTFDDKYDKSGGFLKPVLSTWEKKVPKNKKKINILMILPWLEMGGADLFNLEFVKKINKDIFNISIITTHEGKNTWRRCFEEYTDEVFLLPLFLDKKNYAEFISYYLISRSIDIVFLSNSYDGYYLIPWLKLNFPKVAYVDYVHMEEWYWRNGGFARTSGAIGNFLDKTFVCNDRTRKVMVDCFSRITDSVETVYIGVDAEKFDPRRVKKGNVRNSFNISEDDFVILFPCRIHPQKRPFLMLRIAQELLSYTNKFKILVVGDGPQLDELIMCTKEINLENHILFAGRQENMVDFYGDSNVTLICSLKEGLALTAYESLSMGIPVISSDVGGQAELIDDHVGKIVPMLEDESTSLDNRNFKKCEVILYVNAIFNFMSNPELYAKTCSNAREKILNSFTTDIMVDKLEKKFLLLVGKEICDQRVEKSKYLTNIKNLIEDYTLIYNQYEQNELEKNIIWKEKERILEELKKKTYEEKCKNYDDINSLKNQLDNIYSMRTWKFVQRYVNFMGGNKFGQKLARIKNIFIK